MSACDPDDKRRSAQYPADECYEEPNHYGEQIVLPEYFMGEHDVAVVPASGGSPPVCTCGWTRFKPHGSDSFIELAQHLAEQWPYSPDAYRPVESASGVGGVA